MTTRITVTTGDGGLVERNAQQQAANRQGAVVRNNATKATAAGTERRRLDRIATGRNPETGAPLIPPVSATTLARFGSASTPGIPRLNQQVGASRAGGSFLWKAGFDTEPAILRREVQVFPPIFQKYLQGTTPLYKGRQAYWEGFSTNRGDLDNDDGLNERYYFSTQNGLPTFEVGCPPSTAFDLSLSYTDAVVESLNYASSDVPLSKSNFISSTASIKGLDCEFWAFFDPEVGIYHTHLLTSSIKCGQFDNNGDFLRVVRIQLDYQYRQGDVATFSNIYLTIDQVEPVYIFYGFFEAVDVRYTGWNKFKFVILNNGRISVVVNDAELISNTLSTKLNSLQILPIEYRLRALYSLNLPLGTLYSSSRSVGITESRIIFRT